MGPWCPADWSPSSGRRWPTWPACSRRRGASLHDVAKTTVFVTDMADYGEMNRIYIEVFGDHRPARSAVAVAALPLGARIEVEAWAYRG